MKTWFRVALAGFFVAALAAAYQAGDKIEDAHGTIRKVGTAWYGIVPDEDPGTRFAPDALPEEFRQDGLRVVYSGVVKELPGGRTWGIPLELTAIRLLEEPAEPMTESLVGPTIESTTESAIESTTESAIEFIAMGRFAIR